MSEAVAGDGVPGTVLDERLTVACGEGAVRLLRLQRAGREAMEAEAFLRGLPLLPAGGDFPARVRRRGPARPAPVPPAGVFAARGRRGCGA